MILMDSCDFMIMIVIVIVIMIMIICDDDYISCLYGVEMTIPCMLNDILWFLCDHRPTNRLLRNLFSSL